ncbi:hypothetical protein BDW72DRAFT_154378 [Aspergillus terricola var. indicus]
MHSLTWCTLAETDHSTLAFCVRIGLAYTQFLCAMQPALCICTRRVNTIISRHSWLGWSGAREGFYNQEPPHQHLKFPTKQSRSYMWCCVARMWLSIYLRNAPIDSSEFTGPTAVCPAGAMRQLLANATTQH